MDERKYLSEAYKRYVDQVKKINEIGKKTDKKIHVPFVNTLSLEEVIVNWDNKVEDSEIFD